MFIACKKITTGGQPANCTTGETLIITYTHSFVHSSKNMKLTGGHNHAKFKRYHLHGFFQPKVNTTAAARDSWMNMCFHRLA